VPPQPPAPAHLNPTGLTACLPSHPQVLRVPPPTLLRTLGATRSLCAGIVPTAVRFTVHAGNTSRMSTGSFRFAGVGLAGARAFAPEPEKALDMARDAIRKLRIVVHAAPPSPPASEPGTRCDSRHSPPAALYYRGVMANSGPS